MALLPNLLPSASAPSDTGLLLYLCLCACVHVRVHVSSLHTSVPAHATVLTADPCRNASQHILTAIKAYPFRSQRLGFALRKVPSQSKSRHAQGRKST